MMAGDLGIDRVEFRRRNLITAAEQPYPIASVQPTDAKDEYDSGDYRETLDRALKEFDWAEGIEAAGQADRRQVPRAWRSAASSRAARPGRRRGRGSRSTRTARSRSIMGSSSVGQGVETVFAQIAADALEMPIERIRQVLSRLDLYVSDGYGAYHSRSIVMGGSALLDAARNFQAAIREAGGTAKLGCDAGRDVKIEIDKVSGRRQVVSAQRSSPGSPPRARSSTRSTPTATARMPPTSRSIPSSARCEIVDYVVVQDVGRAVNPLTLRGQVHRLAGAGARRRRAGSI